MPHRTPPGAVAPLPAIPHPHPFALDQESTSRWNELLASSAKIDVAGTLTPRQRTVIEERLLVDVADPSAPRGWRQQKLEAFLAIQSVRLSSAGPVRTGIRVKPEGDEAVRYRAEHRAAVHNLARMQKELEKIDASGRGDEANQLQRRLQQVISVHAHAITAADLRIIHPPGPKLPLELVEEVAREVAASEPPQEAVGELAWMEWAGMEKHGRTMASSLPTAVKTIRSEFAGLSRSGSAPILRDIAQDMAARPGADVLMRSRAEAAFKTHPHVGLWLDTSDGAWNSRLPRAYAHMVASVSPAKLAGTESVHADFESRVFEDAQGQINARTVWEMGNALAHLDRNLAAQAPIHLRLDIVSPVHDHEAPIREFTRKAPNRLKTLEVRGSFNSQEMDQAIAEAIQRPGGNIEHVVLRVGATAVRLRHTLAAAGHENSRVTVLDLLGNLSLAPSVLAPMLSSPHHKLEELDVVLDARNAGECALLSTTLTNPNARRLRRAGFVLPPDSDFRALGDGLKRSLTQQGPATADGGAGGLHRLTLLAKPPAQSDDMIGPLAEALQDTNCRLSFLALDARSMTKEKTLELIQSAMHPDCNLEKLGLSDCPFMQDADVLALLSRAKAKSRG